MAKLVSENGNRMRVECSGGEIHALPISLMLLEQFDAQHQEPTPPMKEITIAGGATEHVEDFEDEQYLLEMSAYNEQTVKDLLNLVVDFGIDVDLPDDDGEWLTRLERVGIEVEPGDEKNAYVHYIIMRNTLGDLKKVMSACFMLSGVSEEVIQSWMGLF